MCVGVERHASRLPRKAICVALCCIVTPNLMLCACVHIIVMHACVLCCRVYDLMSLMYDRCHDIVLSCVPLLFAPCASVAVLHDACLKGCFRLFLYHLIWLLHRALN